METFLVRLWVPSTPDGPDAPLRGIVEQVRTGFRREFVGVGELATALGGAEVEAHAASPAVERLRGGGGCGRRVS
jgi:hypothetical protein